MSLKLARLSFTAALLALVAAPGAAQTDPRRDQARADETAAASARLSPPAQAPEGIRGNPEQMLALDLSSGGRVVLQLRPDVAPQHVERIKSLARAGFYNGLTFHRVIEGFMAQGGDPQGNGTGGSQLPDLPAEFNGLPHVRGALSMARAEAPNSANSQFFIMLLPRLSLDRNYTVFGRVVSGMDIVDRIQRGEPPATPTRIVQASVMADQRPLPPASALTADAALPPPPPAPSAAELDAAPGT